MCRLYVVFVVWYSVYGACPDGFEPHGNSCYKAAGLEASWAEAQMYCQILGSDLAKIESAREELIIEGMLSRQGSIDNIFWVAGTDIVTEGQWVWMDRGGHSVPISGYSNWHSGTAPTDNRNHNCLGLYPHRGKTSWTDEYCNNQHSFLCEIA